MFLLPGPRVMCVWDEFPENQPALEGREAQEAVMEVAMEFVSDSETCMGAYVCICIAWVRMYV
jgi:hypothetical protein